MAAIIIIIYQQVGRDCYVFSIKNINYKIRLTKW